MAKEKSQAVQAMDELQASVRPFLKELGFRARARAFNRITSDGITQVIEFQLGRFDPPGTHYVGIRQNFYGMFTVNVGVFVPELHEYTWNGARKLTFIHEYDCWFRERLGCLGPERQDISWKLEAIPQQAADIFNRIERDALPFLSKFETREAILKLMMEEDSARTDSDFARFERSRQRIACAIILAVRGQKLEAKAILTAALRERADHSSAQKIRGAFRKYGLGEPEF